jgi:opacity protein-like surface antigen
MGLPEDSGFYPAMPEGTLVPARGFGVDAGAHLYFGNVRGARLGAGASFAQVRGTTDAATATVRLLAPQLSINFGTADGWSYLSGGVGTADVTGRFKGSVSADAASRGSATLLALNVGGGARWFFTPHLAVGFDVRLHRLGGQDAQVGLAGTAPTFLMLASAGLSVK